MRLDLQPVVEKEQVLLRNLYSLYLHDLSRFSSNLTIGEDGFFHYEDLELFWSTEGISPYFIKLDDQVIGFLLLLERPYLTKDNDFGINDLFILNPYKGKGFGRGALKKLFNEKRGKYFVIELRENEPAILFWKKVFKDFEIDFDERSQLVDGEDCFIQTFLI